MSAPPSPDQIEPSKLAAAMLRCAQSASSWEGVIFRSTTPRYATSTDLISGEGSRRFGGRWNPAREGGAAAVYGSLDAETAMAETLAHVRYYALPEHAAMPRVFVAIQVKLERVIDLRSPRVQKLLGVSIAKMLDSDWRASLNAPSGEEPCVTQLIGRAASDAKLHGMLVLSAAREKGTNLVVFPANLSAACVLKVKGL